MSIPIETNWPVQTAEEIVNETFFTAQSGRPATNADRKLIADIEAAVKQLALIIEIDVPNGRNKSLAKKALEDVQMRAIRAIFSPIG
ncbi:hypothetical protein SEA_PLATTE_27 [Microbacterium phage Platte]|nr:hypothetical protein SEA_PIONEER3_27 [Microbacterium phage Pioneer3]AWY06357.1 hypothetical protein SEA_TANDEM_27 [Microbacterium phage Tandem]QAU07360.1 hypothetical protein SEA_ALLEB_28 [Microbacterium phage Alleb]QZD97620.1 hypothetical protein SEA_PLATTE_27 [Microbacterium phage Platte]